jgi:hypothetical protein
MANGGQVGIRGYLVQTLIGVLDALQQDHDWTAVTLEPQVESDKVDILWEYRDGTSKAVQVKSTVNEFGKASIEGWARDLQDSHTAARY